MAVLVACEESQEVCKAFRSYGVEAYSCDLRPCSGGFPEWHIQDDAVKVMKSFPWSILIAFPPCTYLSNAGANRLVRDSVLDEERYAKGLEAKEFFLTFLNSDIPHRCIENPSPNGRFNLPPASQQIEPYYFGDAWKKRTLLWLRGLPGLMATELCVYEGYWVHVRKNDLPKRGQKTAFMRSKTFPGVANAMASQWRAYDGR